MSSNRSAAAGAVSAPFAEFQYRHTVAMSAPQEPQTADEAELDHEIRMTEEALRKSLAAERASATAETESRLRQEFEQRCKAETQRITRLVEHFEETRKEYFARVEREVVQLALSIAAKILHREAQVDPMLIGALVQLALGQLKEGAAAAVRVRPQEAKGWQQYFSAQGLSAAVSVVEDAELQPGDCILETNLGSVNLSLDVQLKEVEKGFFDVLAQRPSA